MKITEETIGKGWKKMKKYAGKNSRNNNNGIFLRSIYHEISELIMEDHPEFTEDTFISSSDLNYYRKKYIESLLRKEKAYAQTEEEVLNSILNKEIISENSNKEYSRKQVIGQNIADSVAKFGGSWTFILIFISILLFWIILNSVALIKKPFDPYPYILLNLVLSCLAALQAPVIMMSQNRQEEKDRIRAENDYQVNLKAEIEIKILHEKLNHLITEQWDKLVEIQEIQMELLEDLQNKMELYEKKNHTIK